MKKKYTSLEHAIRTAITEGGVGFGTKGGDKAKGTGGAFYNRYSSKNGGHSAAGARIAAKDAGKENIKMEDAGVPNEGNATPTAKAYGSFDEDGKKKIKEETDRESVENVSRSGKSDRKTVYNVARLGKGTLTKKAEIERKIIDESNKKLAKVVKKTKLGATGTTKDYGDVVFNPPLNKVNIDEDNLAPGIAGSGWDPAELAKLKAANMAKRKPGTTPPASTDDEKTPAPADLKIGQSVPNSGAEKNQAAVDDVGSRLRGGRKIEMPDDETIASRNEIGKAALKTMASFTPAGLPIAAHDAYQNIKQGNYKDAAVDALGALPGVGGLIKGAGTGARVARVATNVAAPAAAVGASLIPSAAAADNEKPPVSGQAKVETPPVTTSSPPKAEAPVKPPVSGQAKVETPPVTTSSPPKAEAPVKPPEKVEPPPQPAPKPPEPAKPATPAPQTRQAVQAAKGEGKVGTALAGFGVSKQDRNNQEFVTKTLGDKYKAGSAASNMALQKHFQSQPKVDPTTQQQQPQEPPKSVTPEPPKPPENTATSKTPEPPTPETESGGKKKKVNESALIEAFLKFQRNYK